MIHSSPAQFYRILSAMLVIGGTGVLLLWALLIRDELVRTEPVQATVIEVLETAGRPVVRLQVAQENEVRLFLPYRRPVPGPGTVTELQAEYYADGKRRYRWPANTAE